MRRISSSANRLFKQWKLSQHYSLSRRTRLYALEAYQRANGQTLGSNGKTIVKATATIGDGVNSTPSSSGSMVVVSVGVVHRF